MRPEHDARSRTERGAAPPTEINAGRPGHIGQLSGRFSAEIGRVGVRRKGT